MPDFGVRFKARMRALVGDNHPISAEELAKKTGISKSTIYSWLNSERIPNVDAAVTIARALGLTVDQMVGETEPPPPLVIEHPFSACLERVTDAAKVGAELNPWSKSAEGRGGFPSVPVSSDTAPPPDQPAEHNPKTQKR